MERESEQPRRRAGRKAKFDRDAALDTALDLFWRHGYEGVGIADLTKAIGVAPPSLYHAFGSKADLYRAVLRRYGSGGMSADEIAAAPSARAAVETLLERGIAAVTRPGGPLGCMVSSGMLMTAPENAGLAAELKAMRAAIRLALERRIERDVADGVLPPATKAGALARYYAATLQGLSAAAVDGASAVELRAVADLALRAWP